MNEWLGFSLMAGSVTLIAMGFFRFFTRRAVPDERLASESDSHEELVLGDLTPALAGQMPATSRDRREILPVLLQGGFYRPTALTEYLAIRTALILTPLVATGAICLMVPPSRIPRVATVGLIVAALGFALPRVYIAMVARKRTAEIERGLPVFADLLSLALMAGQGLVAAVGRVSGQMKTTFPKMSEELVIVQKQAELLSLNVAFEQWANRSQLPELKNLSAIVNQSQRLGNDVAPVLLEYATNIRTTLRQRADAQAQKAAFWMILPTVLCLWGPAAVILTGPLFYEFAQRRSKVRDLNTGPKLGSPEMLQILRRENDPFNARPLPTPTLETGVNSNAR